MSSFGGRVLTAVGIDGDIGTMVGDMLAMTGNGEDLTRINIGSTSIIGGVLKEAYCKF